MSDLRRFPVSDEFSVSWKTLDFDSNRMNFFEFFFSQFAKQNMYLSVRIFSKIETFWAKHGNVGNGLAHRLEALSGVCGACFRSIWSREVRNGHIFSFSWSLRNFGKWGVPKKKLAIRSELFLGGWNRSGVNRWPGGRAILETVQVPRENPACGRFLPLDIPFPTLLVLGCRDPGFEPGKGERWPWLT